MRVEQAVIDFETRSTVDLTVTGVWPYAAHPSTEIMCLSVAVNAARPLLWIPDKFYRLVSGLKLEYETITESRLLNILSQAEKVIAFNAQFEYIIWNNLAVPRRNWPVLLLEKLYDVQAQCAYHALPLNLDMAGRALGLSLVKDSTGHKVMLKLCKPRKPKKGEDLDKIYWHEKPTDLVTLFNYCGKDAEAERAIYHTLPQLPEYERRIWLMDQRINARGVPVDIVAVKALVSVVQQHEQAMLADFNEAVGGTVSGPRSYVALKEWVNETAGLNLESVGKNEVAALLKDDTLPEAVKKALVIKAELSKASVAKLVAMDAFASVDGRARGLFKYHAAATGRAGGVAVQPQNLPRDSYPAQIYDGVIDAFVAENFDCIGMLYDGPFYAASRCIRGAFQTGIGSRFLCGDFSSVEARALAHMAGQIDAIQAFKNNIDPYKIAASSIFGKKYEDINKKERQTGKAAELACIGKDTLIFTNKGLIPVQRVKDSHLLWDGEMYVRHTGVLRNGKKRVIDLFGVKITHDHLILKGKNEWVTAGNLSENIQYQRSALNLGIMSLSGTTLAKKGGLNPFYVSVVVGKFQRLIRKIFSKVNQHAAKIVQELRRVKRASFAPIWKLRKKIVDDYLIAYQRLKVGAANHVTPHTNGTAAEALICTPFGVKIMARFSNIWCHFRDGITLILRLTELIMTKGIIREICDSRLLKSNRTIHPEQIGSVIAVSVCPSPSFGKNIVRDIATPVLLGVKYPKGRRLKRLSMTKKIAEGFIHGIKLWLYNTGEKVLAELNFGKNIAVIMQKHLLSYTVYVAANLRKKLLKTNSCMLEVYDISNCGPNNRYMVMTRRGPLIVHNCGYGGGIGAYAMMAKNYGIDLETLPALLLHTATPDELEGDYGTKALAKRYVATNPGVMSLDAAMTCDLIKRRWRVAKPYITAYWKGIGTAAFNAVESPGDMMSYRGILFKVHRGFLKCKLPSGRVLHYYQPKIEKTMATWGDTISAITFTGMKVVEGKTTRQWARLATFGPRLVENIVQAFCRDLLMEAMLRLEDAGYPPVLHVHDEAVSELENGVGTLDEFLKIMEQVPSWAVGMPIRAEGWEGRRYQK